MRPEVVRVLLGLQLSSAVASDVKNGGEHSCLFEDASPTYENGSDVLGHLRMNAPRVHEVVRMK